MKNIISILPFTVFLFKSEGYDVSLGFLKRQVTADVDTPPPRMV